MRITEKEIEISTEEIEQLCYRVPTYFRWWIFNCMEKITKVPFIFESDIKKEKHKWGDKNV